MNYVAAVSGGVDSVVLLDMLSRSDHRLIVAHVDHGIREESAEDARFVKVLAKRYGLPYVQTSLRLGASASEELARVARYDFLHKVANEHDATIVTAHHQDDMIGSIAINISRGTGWRGLAVMNRSRIHRPLLVWNKEQIYTYALENNLEWVEDATNHDPKYLRNALRAGVVGLSTARTRQIVELRQKQIQLAHDIDREVAKLAERFDSDRQSYTLVSHKVAVEILRKYIELQTSYRPSIEQADRLLLAIKTAKPHTTTDLAKGIRIRFSSKTFVVDNSR